MIRLLENKAEVVALVHEQIDNVLKNQIAMSIDRYYTESLISSNLDEELSKLINSINKLYQGQVRAHQYIKKAFGE